MNITLKLPIYTSKPYADGSHPIILRYTINRKVKKKVLYKCHAGLLFKLTNPALKAI